jgi:hypothetical protein
MKVDLPHLLLAVDLGGSGTKIIGGIQGVGERALIMMPHCIEVKNPGELLFDLDFTEHNTWLKLEGVGYAVGNLAATKFNATNKLKPAKFTVAVPKLCAAIAVFSQLFKLPPKFNLSLTFVLPPAEWEQKTIVIERLQAALKDLDTPKGKIKPKLLSVSANPEGMGVLLGQEINLKDFANITVVMLGHRNASVLTTKFGVMNRPQSSDLGYHNFLKNIASKTGYEEEQLIKPVVEYKKIKIKIDKHEKYIFKKLSRRIDNPVDHSDDYYSNEQIDYDVNIRRQFIEKYQLEIFGNFQSVLKCSGSDLDIERTRLTDVIEKSIIDYTIKLTDWLGENMESGLDRLCLCGGTANFLLDEIKPFLLDRVKNKETERLLQHALLPEDPQSTLFLTDRYHDIYCLYLQLQKDTKTPINPINTPSAEIDTDSLSEEEYMIYVKRTCEYTTIVFKDDDDCN